MENIMALFSEMFGPSGYKKMSCKDAEEYMKENKDYIVLDVRTKDEYKSGHIPKAICIPNETISQKNVSKLKNKNQKIFVYCASGGRSSDACRKLVKLGYTDIVNIGGIMFWRGKIER